MNKQEQARTLFEAARATVEAAGGFDKLDAEGLKTVRKLTADAKALQEAWEQEPARPSVGRAAMMGGFGGPEVRSGDGMAGGGNLGEWGSTVVQAGGYKALASGGVEVALPAATKEIIAPGFGQESLDTDPVRLGSPSMFVRSLCEDKPLDGTTNFSFLRQTVRDFQAGVVAPGATKPTSILTQEKVSGEIDVIAHLSEPQDRYSLLDADYLRDFLNTEMILGVNLAIDNEIVGAILADEAVAEVPFDTSVLVTLRKSKTALALNHVSPSNLIINPADAEKLDLSADDSGRFYFTSAPDRGDASPAWSVPVLQTVAVDEGTGIMGAFRQAIRVYNDGQVRLDTTESGRAFPEDEMNLDELFATNQVVARAETRAKPAIRAPFALVEVDLEEPA